MKDSDKCPTDNETILMALDQIGQTIDVMNSVVGRLRTHLREQDDSATDQANSMLAEMLTDRIIH
jgi:hypothetical protein